MVKRKPTWAMTREEMLVSLRYWAKHEKRPYLLARYQETADAFARLGYVVWGKPHDVPWKGKTLSIIEGELTPLARSLVSRPNPRIGADNS